MDIKELNDSLRAERAIGNQLIFHHPLNNPEVIKYINQQIRQGAEIVSIEPFHFDWLLDPYCDGRLKWGSKVVLTPVPNSEQRGNAEKHERN